MDSSAAAGKKLLFDPATGTRRAAGPANSNNSSNTRESLKANEPLNPKPTPREQRSMRRKRTRPSSESPVVPRILVRQPATNEPQSVLKSPAQSQPKSQPNQQPKSQSPQSHPKNQPALDLFHPDARSTQQPIITATGTLLSTPIRQHLGALRIRACVGILGRADTGKSALISQLAGPTTTAVQDSSTRKARRGCVDVHITGARIALVDTPPVLGQSAGLKWRRHPGVPLRLAARAHDLQIALFMLQVCDTLLVVCDVDRDCVVDWALARLLASARGLVAEIPGLVLPARGGSASGDPGRCRLHILARCATGGACAAGVAAQYEAATGICVARVTFLPGAGDLPSGGLDATALDAAAAWAALPARPLYAAPGPQSHPAPLSVLPALGSLNAQQRPTNKLNACIDELRQCVLAPAAPDLWRNEPEGVWASTCLRAWDSIRRSDKLHALAAAAAATRDPDLDSMDSATTTTSERKGNRPRNRPKR